MLAKPNDHLFKLESYKKDKNKIKEVTDLSLIFSVGQIRIESTFGNVQCWNLNLFAKVPVRNHCVLCKNVNNKGIQSKKRIKQKSGMAALRRKF